MVSRQLVSESFPGQFRNWFYSLGDGTVMAQNRLSCRTLATAMLLGEDGRPMHKAGAMLLV